jgi:DnaK suppressor protein
MQKLDTTHFKKLLDAELEQLTTELSSVGRVNPANKNDWEAKSDDLNVDRADEGEVADSIESLDNNTGAVNKLEQRLNEVKRALAKIANGNYGLCEISNKPIEIERLEANPAARTCIEHMNDSLE